VAEVLSSALGCALVLQPACAEGQCTFCCCCHHPDRCLPAPLQVEDVVGTFRMLAQLPSDSMGAYIISMSHTASDVLAVVLLQKECGGERGVLGAWCWLPGCGGKKAGHVHPLPFLSWWTLTRAPRLFTRPAALLITLAPTHLRMLSACSEAHAAGGAPV